MEEPIGPMEGLLGQMLGQYRIVEPLGHGGMATVFKAFQPSLERYVAIKVLPPYYAHEPGFAQRFTREAKAVAQLEHPHILPVHDFGQQGDYSYIVMRYVPAGTLKELIASGSLSLEQSTDIVCQIAEALDYAHEHGVIHRDVKPSNVLVDQGRWALLMDFGLARMVEGSKQLTASGVGVGTPAYMAPEQGQGRRVDGRADVYSLGVVLFEALTGQVPYDAETPMAVVLKHIVEPLPVPRSFNPSIPESVEGVILRALAKDPEDRYATAGEMAAALRAALQAAPVEAEAWPEEAFVPTEVAPESLEVALAQPEERLLSTSAAVPERAKTGEAVEIPSRPKVPWWAFVVGAVSLLALVGVVLMATGVLRPSVTDAPVPPVPQAPTVGTVVDNLDPDFAIEAGDWGSCEDGDCEGISYGADFRYADPGCTYCRARFDLTVTAAGKYDLWTWWPQGEDRATDTSFTIQHGDGPLNVNVDQRHNGSAWYQLATLTFDAGELVSIVVQGTATGYANADAVALTPAGAWQPGAPAQHAPDFAIVVDNVDPDFAIEAGDWGSSEDDDAYGGDFWYAAPDCVSCRARFDVEIATAGEYDLWTWWPQGDDRATDTPFIIRYGDDTVVVRVDQRHNGTAWYRLATLTFDEGESVRIIVGGTDTDSGYANADAIALTPAGSWRP